MEDSIFGKEMIHIHKPRIEEPTKRLTKLDLLRKLSAGTELRNGINDIVSGGLGALIVIYNSKVASVFQGGFRVDCKFTSKRLAELAKMDGAIILSEDFKKILYANALLIPDNTLSTTETGTRHQAAERTAKQIEGLVIAVSQRRGEITLYYGNNRYVLQHTEPLLGRATETLQILEKQREILNELLTNLNVLEMTGLVSNEDVCRILQRVEIIKKMSNIINEHIVELGKDGVILRMRMREITRGIEKEEALIIRDYIKRPLRIKQFFDSLNFEEILDLDTICNNLFKESIELEINTKGYRILSKIGTDKDLADKLVGFFGSLNSVIEADIDDLRKILKSDAEDFKRELSNLREQILVGKNI